MSWIDAGGGKKNEQESFEIPTSQWHHQKPSPYSGHSCCRRSHFDKSRNPFQAEEKVQSEGKAAQGGDATNQ